MCCYEVALWRCQGRCGRGFLKSEQARTREFNAALYSEIIPLIGPDADIPAPDVGTDAQVMAWFMDTYSMHVGHTVPAVVTGKPVEVGGSEGRSLATSTGMLVATSEVLRRQGKPVADGATVAIQGAGNVGWGALEAVSKTHLTLPTIYSV